MRPASKHILLLVLVAFLTTTLSGLHFHADAAGHDETVSHAQNVHPDLPSNLDHETEHHDISVFEPASGFSKGDIQVPVFAMPELAERPNVETAWSQYLTRLAPKYHAYLRQPVRAPPLCV